MLRKVSNIPAILLKEELINRTVKKQLVNNKNRLEKKE